MPAGCRRYGPGNWSAATAAIIIIATSVITVISVAAVTASVLVAILSAVITIVGAIIADNISIFATSIIAVVVIVLGRTHNYLKHNFVVLFYGFIEVAEIAGYETSR